MSRMINVKHLIVNDTLRTHYQLWLMSINWNTKETWIHPTNKKRKKKNQRWNFSLMCLHMMKKKVVCATRCIHYIHAHRRKLHRNVRKWDSECVIIRTRGKKPTQSFQTPTFIQKTSLTLYLFQYQQKEYRCRWCFGCCCRRMLLPLQTPLITLSNSFALHCVCPISFQTNRTYVRMQSTLCYAFIAFNMLNNIRTRVFKFMYL